MVLGAKAPGRVGPRQGTLLKNRPRILGTVLFIHADIFAAGSVVVAGIAAEIIEQPF